MSLPEAVPTLELSGLTNASTLVLRFANKIYEIMAVEQDAKDLLETTAQISSQLEHAKKLRRQKSDVLRYDEKDMVDRVIDTSEQTIHSVASLAEPVRVDMKTSGGQVRLTTRLQFVFRDMAQIPLCLSKLGIAGSNINHILTILYSREDPRERPRSDTPRHRTSPNPPTYQEPEWSEWLYASRQKNLRKRPTGMAGSVSSMSSHSDLQLSSGSISELADTSSQRHGPFTDASFISYYEKDVKAQQDTVAELAGSTEPIYRPYRPKGAVVSDSASEGLEVDERPGKNVGNLEPSSYYAPPEKSIKPLTGKARSRRWMEYHLNG